MQNANTQHEALNANYISLYLITALLRHCNVNRETAKPGHMKMTEAVRGRIAEAKTALVEIVCGLVRPKTQKR